MRNNRKEIRRIVIVAIVIWFLSLLVFAIPVIGTGQADFFCLYGVWNLGIFSFAYLFISRKVSVVMQQVDDCIQSLIDGSPIQRFSAGEESLLGKFQMQIMKLYQILNSSRENEERQRKEMSSLIADLVHQINTPLTNIQIYSGFLMQDHAAKEEKAKLCEIINSQIEKLGWFADGFTKTARLEEDMRKLQPRQQKILPMILSAIDEISVQAEACGDEICLLGEQGIVAYFDQRWTEEAVFNLLDNAVKYGEEGSKICVKMTAYEIYVRIDVVNYGKPLPKEEYARVFDRYYRGENAACIKEGVGLGLYLVGQIVAGQGGYVKVGNFEGKGNVFSIFLLKSFRG